MFRPKVGIHLARDHSLAGKFDHSAAAPAPGLTPSPAPGAAPIRELTSTRQRNRKCPYIGPSGGVICSTTALSIQSHTANRSSVPFATAGEKEIEVEYSVGILR